MSPIFRVPILLNPDLAAPNHWHVDALAGDVFTFTPNNEHAAPATISKVSFGDNRCG